MRGFRINYPIGVVVVYSVCGHEICLRCSMRWKSRSAGFNNMTRFVKKVTQKRPVIVVINEAATHEYWVVMCGCD